MKKTKIVSKVISKNNKYKYGRISLPEKWVGRIVEINTLPVEKERAYKQKEKEYEKNIEESKKKLKNHLIKLKKLRG